MKLHGHWIAKRTGILDHYKCMTMAEIVLFDTYLLLANKESWECWLTVKQLMKLLPIKRDTIFRAKKGLLNKGWIQRVNRTGVFIPKLFRYVNSEAQKVDNIDLNTDSGVQKVENIDLKVDNIDLNTDSGVQKVENIDLKVENIDLKVDNIDPSNNKNNNKNNNNKNILQLLKSIPDYPFNHQKDLAFIQDLVIEFPGANISNNIKDWKVWLLDNPLKGKINYRSRLRKWIQTSMRYKKEGEYKKGDLSNKSERKGFDLPSDYPID